MFAVLWAVGCFRLLPEVGQLGLAMGWLDDTHERGGIIYEHFVGGAHHGHVCDHDGIG